MRRVLDTGKGEYGGRSLDPADVIKNVTLPP
jgi:hypothetical protein